MLKPNKLEKLNQQKKLKFGQNDISIGLVNFDFFLI